MIMEKEFISNSVCGLLAQQLVEEQAEVVKHQGTVNIIKRTILEKKTEVIKRLVRGRFFKFNGMKVIVMNVESYETERGFIVTLTFGEDPESATRYIQLTKKEKDLLAQYTEAFGQCKLDLDNDWERKASKAGYSLGYLKHGICPINQIYREFNFDGAKDPDYFKTTGIFVNEFRGCSSRKLMLEETIVRNV